MIGADMFLETFASDRVIEHPACRNAIDVGGFDAEADDAAAENVHDQHHPMAAQDDRFAAKEIYAPQTTFRVGDECEPGWTRGARAP